MAHEFSFMTHQANRKLTKSHDTASKPPTWQAITKSIPGFIPEFIKFMDVKSTNASWVYVPSSRTSWGPGGACVGSYLANTENNNMEEYFEVYKSWNHACTKLQPVVRMLLSYAPSGNFLFL